MIRRKGKAGRCYPTSDKQPGQCRPRRSGPGPTAVIHRLRGKCREVADHCLMIGISRPQGVTQSWILCGCNAVSSCRSPCQGGHRQLAGRCLPSVRLDKQRMGTAQAKLTAKLEIAKFFKPSESAPQAIYGDTMSPTKWGFACVQRGNSKQCVR